MKNSDQFEFPITFKKKEINCTFIILFVENICKNKKSSLCLNFKMPIYIELFENIRFKKVIEF